MTDEIRIHGCLVPVLGGDEFTTTEWDKVVKFHPQYEELCRAAGVKPHDRLHYVLAFCRELEKTGIRRDGRNRTATELFWRIADHFGRGWFNDKVLGSKEPYVMGLNDNDEKRFIAELLMDPDLKDIDHARQSGGKS